MASPKTPGKDTKSASAKKDTASKKPAPKAAASAKAAPKQAPKTSAATFKKPAAPKVKAPKQPSVQRWYGTGRRKNAIARVWVAPGSGKITINDKDIGQYFARPVLRMMINQPLSVINGVGRYDVIATVVGGGLSGQAGAIRHGLSRALKSYDIALHQPLRQAGFLTRDSRVVERKKYGRAKARKRFQFSKR